MCIRPSRTALTSGRSGFSSCTATSASMRSTSATSMEQRRSTIVVGCVRLNCARCGRIHSVPKPFGDRAAHHAARGQVLIEMRAQRVAGALHLLRARVDRAAFGGERDAFRQAIEQAEAERLFEPLHPPHDGRRTGAQRGCGLAEAQRARDHDEDAQVVPRNALEQRRPRWAAPFLQHPVPIILPPPRAPLALCYFSEANSLRKSCEDAHEFRMRVASRRPLIVRRNRVGRAGGTT